MNLNEYGQIAYDEWINTTKIRTCVELDAFIIMPDHIHGIIIILPPVGATGSVAHVKGKIEEHQFFNKMKDPNAHKRFSLTYKKSLQPNFLGSIIGQYKSVVTKIIRKMGLSEFQWQRNYYDQIIRSKPELNAIRKYILENPVYYQIKNIFKGIHLEYIRRFTRCRGDPMGRPHLNKNISMDYFAK